MTGTIVLENSSHKLVKTVSEDSYTAFCFFWGGPFRAIYSVRKDGDNTVGNFTLWKLDKTTGIWGCFADAHDLGFDYSTKFGARLEEVPEDDLAEPNAFEAVEDRVLFDFLDIAVKHTGSIYFDPDTAISRVPAEWLKLALLADETEET